jgi:hypothetical protein
MPNTGESSVVGPAFLAKLAFLRLCGSLAASARVLEGRSIRYCNLGPQSKGGLFKEMVLAICGGNIPWSCSIRRADDSELTLESQYISSITINVREFVSVSFL